jgi:hypothetical protein
MDKPPNWFSYFARESCYTQGVPGIYEALHSTWEWAGKDVRIWSGQSSDHI